MECAFRSPGIVYNNFPWPENPTDAQRAAIEVAAQGVFDARAAHPNASLADLYDPVTMPPSLVKAHQALDVAVDAAYGRKNFRNDAERVAFLFELYQKYTSLLPSSAPARKSRKRFGQTAQDGDETVKRVVARLNEIERLVNQRIVVEETRRGWRSRIEPATA
jgi:hypothetical protein